jgi:hypothetical protein
MGVVDRPRDQVVSRRAITRRRDFAGPSPAGEMCAGQESRGPQPASKGVGILDSGQAVSGLRWAVGLQPRVKR